MHPVFQREYDLTSWRGLNLGTLAYVVGSTPLGVDGFEASPQPETWDSRGVAMPRRAPQRREPVAVAAAV